MKAFKMILYAICYGMLWWIRIYEVVRMLWYAIQMLWCEIPMLLLWALNVMLYAMVYVVKDAWADCTSKATLKDSNESL